MIMKKSNIVILIALLISTTACRKDYTCTCLYTVPVPGASPPTYTTQTNNTFNTIKKDAENMCNDIEATLLFDAQQQGGTVSCTLQETK